MTALSDEFRAAAAELIDLFGRDGCIIRRQEKVFPDPERPTMVEFKNTDYPCKAALIAWTEEQIKMNPALREDQQVIIEWNPQLPDRLLPGDQFIDGKMMYKIVPPEDVYSVNGVIVIWRILVRG